MALFSFFRSVYSLDNLDTRFTTSATTPSTAAASARRNPARATSAEDTKIAIRDNGEQDIVSKDQPSLWNTPEFYLYYLVVCIALPLMIYGAVNVSQPSHPEYHRYEHLLSPGWIPGRQVDNSDGQYASFRGNLPYMFILVIVHPLLRRLFNAVVPASAIPTAGTSSGAIAAEAHFEQRVLFDRYFAFVFMVALHGFSALKVLLILWINFSIAHKLPRRYVPAITWIFTISILFANELSWGYPWTSIAQVLLPFTIGKDGKNWGNYLDEYGGLIPRWEVLFKITVLRMISYNMDYVWSRNASDSSPIEKKQLDPACLSERHRVSLSAAPQHYNFYNYLSYTLYSPLYVAGPILTFNDYVSQSHYPVAHLTRSRVLTYGIRFLLCLLCMEVMIHFVYAIAISKADPDWGAYTPFQLSMLGYFSLHHIWLKLLLPWRFFRLWALADGLDPPENMVRCVSDNYSALGFWRNWHRSFNRWVVRYVYIPLGGAGQRRTTRGKWSAVRAGVNYLAVFSFVALWHDINLRLLIWGWMIVFFIAPEVLATLAFPAKRWESRPTTYRLLCGVGAVGNILMMMAANLVGFALGLDGLKGMLQGIIGSYAGVVYMLSACAALFVGAQIMFEHREEEMRHGINLRC